MTAERARIPESGLSAEQVSAALRERQADDVAWRDGRMWSLVYSAGPEHDQVVQDAYREFASMNLLGPTAFPSVATMESEVVAMLLDHLGADPETAGGTMTSGGTESIILAVKSYREAARHERPDVREPEMVVPATAHPAFLKAAGLLGIRAVLIPVDETYRADPKAFADAITPSTILGCASAPCFPYGVVDPIDELGDIAAEHGIGLHIDAALGGFALPFVRELGYEVPPFDFAVPGVTSITADLHKYGYGPKGSSTVLYRDRAQRRHQFDVYPDWPGGVLAAPTILGTRSGGTVAGAWAALVFQGRDGYRSLFAGIMDTTRKLQQGIAAIGGLSVVGEPPMSVFAVTSAAVDMMAVADRLEERHWRIDRQRDPDSIHLIINPVHAAVADEFLADLRDAVAGAPAAGSSADELTLYGVTSRVAATDDVAGAVLDQLEARYDR